MRRQSELADVPLREVPVPAQRAFDGHERTGGVVDGHELRGGRDGLEAALDGVLALLAWTDTQRQLWGELGPTPAPRDQRQLGKWPARSALPRS